ncbi:MAG TPA: HEAT repeat domain-containing protein, partial [Solirubrobacteraceae bacterium]
EGGRVRAEARRALETMGVAAVPALVDLLGSTNTAAVLATLEALTALGDGAHAALVPRLADPNWLIRRRAAYVLARTATPSIARRFAVMAASDRDAVVRAAAIEGLGRSPVAGTVAVVAGALASDPAIDVRVEAATVLARVPDGAGREALTRALDDPAFPVRLAARKALAGLPR